MLAGPTRTGLFTGFGRFSAIEKFICNWVYGAVEFYPVGYTNEHSARQQGQQLTNVCGTRPDLCDGSYDQYCGMTPRFSNITAVLEHYDQGELIEFMNRYWTAK